MPQTALVLRTGLRTWRRVDANFQAFAVDKIGQRLHVGELAVGLDVPFCVAHTFPSVVDVDVGVSRFPHPARYHRLCLRANSCIINFIVEVIPAIPSHWRACCKFATLCCGGMWIEKRKRRQRETDQALSCNYHGSDSPAIK